MGCVAMSRCTYIHIEQSICYFIIAIMSVSVIAVVSDEIARFEWAAQAKGDDDDDDQW